MEIYRPFFVQVYQTMGSSLPIGMWAEIIGKNLPMFASESQIYNPATVRVRMTKSVTDPEGVVQLDVSLADHDWYSKLTATIGSMIGRRSGTPVDIVTDAGRLISDMTSPELNNAGDLDVIDRRTGAPVHTTRVVAPPRHMASDKHLDILEWFQGIREPLIDAIVEQVQNKDRVSLQPAVSENGPVHQAVESFILDSTDDWGKFLQIYAENDAVRGLDPHRVAHQIARSVLTEVRKSLRANQSQIKIFFAYKKGDAEKLWDDKISSNISKPYYHSELEMYGDITSDALHKTMLERKIYHIIHAGANLMSNDNNNTRVVPTKRIQRAPSSSARQHPLDWYYHKHHYDRYGKLPGHVMKSFNRHFDNGERRQRPAYTGDPIRAIKMFHLFSGRHVLPETTTAKRRKAELIDIVDNVPPVARKMPPLVPINKRKAHLIPIADDMFDDELELNKDTNVFEDTLPIW